MVPQQNIDGSRSETPTNSGLHPLFGSQLVDKNSSTPYSDATQVGRWFLVWMSIGYSENWITNFDLNKKLFEYFEFFRKIGNY